jgi:hypothetical protein
MLELIVSQIDEVAKSAGGLGEHLEALAIEGGIVRQVVLDAEERDLFNVYGAIAGVGETRPVVISVALPAEH